MNNDSILAVSNFNKYILRLTSKILSYNDENKILFLKRLLDEKIDLNKIDKGILDKLKNSISLLSDKTKNWLSKEFVKLKQDENSCIEKLVNSLKLKEFATKFNYVKPFILLFLSYKFDIL